MLIKFALRSGSKDTGVSFSPSRLGGDTESEVIPRSSRSENSLTRSSLPGVVPVEEWKLFLVLESRKFVQCRS